MDKKKKNTLSYCIPKLLHEVPLCGEVLAYNNNVAIYKLRILPQLPSFISVYLRS